MGRGKTMVDEFSPVISCKADKYLNGMASGTVPRTRAASVSFSAEKKKAKDRRSRSTPVVIELAQKTLLAPYSWQL